MMNNQINNLVNNIEFLLLMSKQQIYNLHLYLREVCQFRILLYHSKTYNKISINKLLI